MASGEIVYFHHWYAATKHAATKQKCSLRGASRREINQFAWCDSSQIFMPKMGSRGAPWRPCFGPPIPQYGILMPGAVARTSPMAYLFLRQC